MIISRHSLFMHRIIRDSISLVFFFIFAFALAGYLQYGIGYRTIYSSLTETYVHMEAKNKETIPHNG
jgi:uncharacterized protein with PQ loop repeat